MGSVVVFLLKLESATDFFVVFGLILFSLAFDLVLHCWEVLIASSMRMQVQIMLSIKEKGSGRIIF